jgi:hypothetical protein
VSVFILPRLRAGVRRAGIERLIDEARRRARQRWLGALALALAAALAVGVFSVLRHGGGPAASNPYAQESVQRQAATIRDRSVRFADLPHGAPRWRIPGDVRAASRLVGRLDGGSIFASPTRDGYWEMFGVGRGGWGGGIPWRAGGHRAPPRGAAVVGGGGIAKGNGVFVRIGGSTRVAPGAKLFVVYADGSRERIKVIWVSKPIGAGFYYHAIPKAHRVRVRRATALELVRGSRVVARQVFPMLPHGR